MKGNDIDGSRRSATLACAAIVIALLSALVPVAPAAAQTSRAAVIAEQQAAKARNLAEERAPQGEVVVKRVMSSSLLAGTGGIYPWFGSLHSGTGFAVGVGYLRPFARGSRVVTSAAISTNGSMGADGTWRLPTFGTGSLVRPWVSANWARLNDLPSYGVGNDSHRQDGGNYDYRPHGATGGLALDAAHGLSLTSGVGYLGFSTEETSPIAGRVPGLGESLSFIVTQAGARLDWRPSPGYSTHGGYVRGEWAHHAARQDAARDFDRYEFEVAHQVSFVRDYFGLGFRALATTTKTADGDEVPFVLLPFVGSGDTVRAYSTRRFTDRSRFVANAEYRWRPSRYLDMAVFLDGGAVGPALGSIAMSDLHAGYGIGARVHGPTFSALRIDVAHGPEGFRVVFAGGLPF